MEIIGMSGSRNSRKLADLSAQFPASKLCVTGESAGISTLLPRPLLLSASKPA
jgi:hypothetical protein